MSELLSTQRERPDQRQLDEVRPDLAVVRLRHPWRWVAAVVVLLFVAWLIRVLIVTQTLEWSVVGRYLFATPVLHGVLNTLMLTALIMVLGIVIGTLVAVMRLSPNPVLTSVAAGYQWFFRGTPTLVQLVFWFNFASVFPRINIHLLGLTFIDADTNAVMTPLTAALLGLGLNFSAYYSEIVRAGILSVDEGQVDSAAAYGLSRGQTLRYIILPQAMRVIIPPTGNEAIGMLKWTSLASIVSYSELMTTVQGIYNVNFRPIPLLIVAALWYLFLTTVLSIVQVFIERRFARGTTRHSRAPWWSSLFTRRWETVRRR